MAEEKPKVEIAGCWLGKGKPRPCYIIKKEFSSNVMEIKDDTFDYSDTKYAAGFIKSKDSIANNYN